MNSIERLRQAIDFLKEKDGALTNDLISTSLKYRSKTYVSDILGESKPINDIFLEKLKVEYSINPEWILYGIGEMAIPKPPLDSGEKNYLTDRRTLKYEKNNPLSIPFFDTEAMAGTNYSAEMNAVTKPNSSIDVGDLLRDSQTAMRVYGNSMIPNYPPGSVIGMIVKTDLLIHPGQVYVVETADERWIKRIYQGDDPDLLELHSDNTMLHDNGPRTGKYYYPAFSIHRKQIKKLYLVTGVIKRNANTVIQ